MKSAHPAMPYIVANVLVFVLSGLLGVLLFFGGYPGLVNNWISEYMALPSDTSRLLTHFYTILTYAFFHSDVFHLLFNMLWLFWMGRIFGEFLKQRQFHFIYWGGIVAGGLLYLLAYRLIPAYAGEQGILIGSSAAVMAILVAVGTYVPNYQISLLFFGVVRVKYLVLAYVLLDILSTGGQNAGGSIAHLGGAMVGFFYVRSLRSGKDWSQWLKKRQPKWKVTKNEPQKGRQAPVVSQERIDAILDKISRSGYDRLSKEEKDLLFKASNAQSAPQKKDP